MRHLTIAPQTEGKGRTFRALLLASVTADALWSAGGGDEMRPAWLMLAGSDAELRPFVANLLLGKKAVIDTRRGRGDKLAILKSAGYQYAWQREAEGSICTIYLPELFRLDPGMVDPAGISFLCLPTVEYLAAQKIDPKRAVAHCMRLDGEQDAAALASMVPLAYLFAAYLDRRTRLPIVADGRFYLQLLLAALAQGAASWPEDIQPRYGAPRALFCAVDTSEVGYGRGIACRASHEAMGELLAEQVEIYFERTGRK